MNRTIPNQQRGFTLLELMVGSAIALFLTTAAIVFATHESRLLGFSNERMELQQSARTIIEMMNFDIQMAGTGLGYEGDDDFVGLQTGEFTTLGGLVLNQGGAAMVNLKTGRPLSATPGGAVNPDYVMPVEDLGVIYAKGPFATIAAQGAGIFQLCDDPADEQFTDDEDQLVVLRTEDMLSAYTVLLSPGAFGGCVYGQCAPYVGATWTGCRAATITPDPFSTPVFLSEASAPTLIYSGGEIHGGVVQALWFVEPDPDYQGRANLHRAEISSAAGCSGTRAECGGVFAYNVETLQYEMWMFNAEGTDDATTVNVDERWVAVQQVMGSWQAKNGTAIDKRSRMRVDVELVLRATDAGDSPHPAIPLSLASGTCVPNGDALTQAGVSCGPNVAAVDQVFRQAYRFSVEVKNSGRMDMRFGAR